MSKNGRTAESDAFPQCVRRRGGKWSEALEEGANVSIDHNEESRTAFLTKSNTKPA